MKSSSSGLKGVEGLIYAGFCRIEADKTSTDAESKWRRTPGTLPLLS
jgi:hypothetical protein